MSRKQKSELKLLELRGKLNKFSGKDSLTSDEAAKVEALEGNLRAAEVEFRSAIRAEEESRQAAGAGAERTALEARVELRRYVRSVVNGEAFDGREREYQQAQDLSGHRIRLAAFAPPSVPETRADATTNAPAEVGQSQRTVRQRIFADSAAAWLGVRMDRVPAGIPVYPVISAGATPSRLAAGADYGDVPAATIGSFTLSPRRSQVAYSARYEDLAKFGSMTLDSALRSDMSGAIREHVDNTILTSTANPVGFFSELASPSDPSDTLDLASFLRSWSSAVDGRYAYRASDVKMLLGAKTYQFIQGLLTASGGLTSSDVWTTLGGEGAHRVSAHIPAPASNIQTAISSARMNAGCAVMGMWPGIELIMDRVTASKEGRVILTIVKLWDFKVIREAPFAVQKFKLA